MNKWICIVQIYISLCLQVYGDKTYCSILISQQELIKHCYTMSTYKDCQSTCQQNIISKRHKDQDCPWGDAPNAKGCDMINNLTSELYCIAPLNKERLSEDIVIGMNCCGSCLETTKQKAPKRGSTWRNTYPGLY